MDTNRTMLRHAANAAGILIHDGLASQPDLAWELEDALRLPLSEKSASIAALVLIYTLSKTRGQHGTARPEVIQYWDDANTPGSSLRFIPAAPLALRLLRAIPPETADRVLRITHEAAAQVDESTEISNLIQGLLEDRKQLGAYHTIPTSATLMAHLAVPEEIREHPEMTTELRMADYACGSGELLTAAYRRIRELQKEGGQDPREHHHRMMTRNITMVDILPASMAIAATELELMEPDPPGPATESTQAVTLRVGPINSAEWPRNNRPVGMGSLDLLEPGSIQRQDLRPISREENPKRVELENQQQDLVLMNPPYTKPAGTFNMDRNIPGGPEEVAPTSPGEQEKIAERMLRANETVHAGNGNGMALHFSYIADLMVREGGTIAMLLPMSAVTNHNGRQRHNEGWSVFRDRMLKDYGDILIIGVASFKDNGCNFSQETYISEIMLLARRLQPGEKNDGNGCFITLARRPHSDEETESIARTIRQNRREMELDQTGLHREIVLDGERIGTMVRDRIGEEETWPMTRVMNPGVVQAARKLHEGTLLDREGFRGRVPTTILAKIAQTGPTKANIDEKMTKPRQGMPKYQVLQQHKCNAQRSLEVNDVEELSPKSGGRRLSEQRLIRGMSQLHINNNFRYNSQSLTACMTTKPSIGGRGWPSILMEKTRWQKALCAWLNSTPGLIAHWCWSNRTQNGRGYINRDRIEKLPVLDLSRLDSQQLRALEQIYDRTRETLLMPANEAWRDPARAELDRQVLRALGMGEKEFQEMRTLCRQWCQEPTVQSRKGETGHGREEMRQLGELVASGRPDELPDHPPLYQEDNWLDEGRREIRLHRNGAQERRGPEPSPGRNGMKSEPEPIMAMATMTMTEEPETARADGDNRYGRREKLLREISQALGIEVHAVLRTRKGKNSYNLRTGHGPISMGGVENILSQNTFRNTIADAIQRVVTEQKPARNWEKLAEKILQASVETEAASGSEKGEAAEEGRE